MFLPLSTYRLQMNYQFTFAQALSILDYLHTLGVSHLYVSPLLAAKPQSMHGYDVVDHSRINPEIGTEDELAQLVAKLRTHAMGMLVDCVPNHMFIVDKANQWWHNVLENGPSSPYTDYFDIDWKAQHTGWKNKVLLPLLNQQYGEALEEQSLKVIFQQGAFFIALATLLLPTDPCSWIELLTPLAAKLSKAQGETDPPVLELTSIITALKHLPSNMTRDQNRIKERQREKEIIKHRLSKLFTKQPALAPLLEKQLQKLNGTKGEPLSFNRLEEFLNAQPYRLCYWRVASDEINYRRFFDICDLAGIKTERQEVFADIHRKLLEWIGKQWIDGLRIDHIDGLIDPEGYLQELQKSCCRSLAKEPSTNTLPAFYVIAEKILTGKEQLRPTWCLAGTVGYDFLNQVNGLFIQQQNQPALYELYRQFTGVQQAVGDITYLSKKLILLVSMSSEHHVLTHFLYRIAKQHRSSRDFTEESLRAALRDIIACFPVYRSYIRLQPNSIQVEDQAYIQRTIDKAKRLNPVVSGSVFDFIGTVLLLKFLPGLNEEQMAERGNFVLRFQQLTGPVTAKGIEDTAFYRFYPLASLNEVGSDLQSFGYSSSEFHAHNSQQLAQWPHTLLASSTHDTKRSEDVRARLNVLSEIPAAWQEALQQWNLLNRAHKVKFEDELFPDTNDEYLFYQTLLGTWPLLPMDQAAQQSYVERIKSYMEKAIHEAKIYTSWINPNTVYDKAMQTFIDKIFAARESPFLKMLRDFSLKIQVAGMLNSLAQLLLKMTSPGVPDIYQGMEMWDFRLVDPDNRHSVDFTHHQQLLMALQSCTLGPELIQALMQQPEDGRIKLFITWQALQLRRRWPAVFQQGEYIPLVVAGAKSEHCIAFMRHLEDQWVITIVTRFFMDVINPQPPYLSGALWQDTSVLLPADAPLKYHSIFYNQTVEAQQNTLPLSACLGHLPIALLVAPCS